MATDAHWLGLVRLRLGCDGRVDGDDDAGELRSVVHTHALDVGFGPQHAGSIVRPFTGEDVGVAFRVGAERALGLGYERVGQVGAVVLPRGVDVTRVGALGGGEFAVQEVRLIGRVHHNDGPVG